MYTDTHNDWKNKDYQVNKPAKLKTIMLFGAGASRPSGIPTIDEMTKEFLEEYPKTRIKKRVLPFLSTLKKITKFQFGRIDLETIMSVIGQFEDEKYRNLLENKFPQAKNLQHLEYFKEAIQDFIRDKCENLSDVNYLWPLRAFFTDNNPLKIFTLNYDGTIEIHCEKEGIKYSDGFNPYWNPQSFSSDLDIHLYKLHGSLYWFKGKTSQAIKVPIKGLSTKYLRNMTDEKVSELMIYPEIEKNKESVIYSHMAQQFKDELLKVDVCVIVGYSFRDHDITDTINESLLINSSLWLILVNPHASKTKEEFFPNDDAIKSRIITLDMGIEEALTDRISYSMISTLTVTRTQERNANTEQAKNQKRLDYEYWNPIIQNYLRINHDDRIKFLVEGLSNTKFADITTDYPNVFEMILCGRSLCYMWEYKKHKNQEKFKIWQDIFLGTSAIIEYIFFKEAKEENLQKFNPVKPKDLPSWFKDRHFGNTENFIDLLNEEVSILKNKISHSKLKTNLGKLKETTDVLTQKKILESGGYRPVTSQEIVNQYKQNNLGILKWAKEIINSL